MERHFASVFFFSLSLRFQSPVARISQVSSNPLRGRKADTSCESSCNKVQPTEDKSHLLDRERPSEEIGRLFVLARLIVLLIAPFVSVHFIGFLVDPSSMSLGSVSPLVWWLERIQSTGWPLRYFKRQLSRGDVDKRHFICKIRCPIWNVTAVDFNWARMMDYHCHLLKMSVLM